MVIKNNRNNMVNFGSIENGNVFILYGEDVYMKIESTYCDDNGDYENSVNLARGTLHYFNNDIMVQPVKCELVID